MLSLFRRDTVAAARERAERVQGDLAAARGELAEATSSLGTAAAVHKGGPSLASARKRAASARERVAELELAEDVARRALAAAEAREAERARRGRVAATRETTQARQEAAAAFDAAVAALGSAWADYRAAAEQDYRARRAAGLPPGSQARSHVRLLRALRAGAPDLFRALRLGPVTSAQAAPLAAECGPPAPEAPPAAAGTEDAA